MNDVNVYIETLVDYAVQDELIGEADRVWARNQLLEALKLDDYEEPESILCPCLLEDMLRAILDDAVARGIIEDDITSRDRKSVV